MQTSMAAFVLRQTGHIFCDVVQNCIPDMLSRCLGLGAFPDLDVMHLYMLSEGVSTLQEKN